MKTTLLALLALSACLDPELDQTEQDVDSGARDRVFSISGGTARSTAQTAPMGGFGARDELAGTQLQKLATERNLDGHLSLFAIGGDGVLYGRYQTAPGGGWNPESWQSLGGAWIVQVTTARNFDGRIELFVRNTAGNIFHRFQITPNGGWNPEGWLPFSGHDIQTISAAQRPDGRIEVVAIGGDGHAYHRTQTAANGGWDADWSLLSGTNLAQVTLIRGGNSVMHMVAVDTAGNVEDATETTSSAWSGFSTIGNKRMSTVVVGATWIDLHLHVLGISAVGTVYELTQDKNTFAWNSSFVGPMWSNVAQLAVADQADGSLIAFARETDAGIYVATQTLGAWGSPSFLYVEGSGNTDVTAIDQQ